MIAAAVQSPPATALQPAAAYVRRSTDKQEQSLGDQRREVALWAERNGFRIIREFVDDAVSGTSAKRRPGFQEMIAEAQRGGFVAVIVWNSDRFSRGDVTETEHYRYMLREAGVTLLSVTEDYLAKDGIDGDVLRAVKQFQNRQYSVSLSQNVLRGQVSSVKKAGDPGRLTPYGYDRQILGSDGAVLYMVRFLEGGDRETFDREGRPLARYTRGEDLLKPGKQCTAKLVLSDPARVAVVKEIFESCVAGRGFRQITAELNRRGVLSPRGRLWQHTTIKALVENPVYYGAIVWNRRTESKFFEVRKGRADKMKSSVRSGCVERTEREDWIVIEDALPAIVDKATWEKAQTAAAVRADRCGGQGRQDNRWLLSGVMRCAHCGQPYTGVNKRKGRTVGQAEVVTPYYHCSGRRKCGKCVCPCSAHVRADALEAWVLDELKGMVFRDGQGVEQAIDWFVRAVRGTRPSDAMTGKHKQEIAQIERQVDALVTGLDPANLALVNDRMTKLRTRRDYLLQQVRAAEADDTAMDEKALRKWATERIGMLAEIMAGRRDEKARQVIASYVDEIVIEPETKTGYMAVNAALGDEPRHDGNGGPTDPADAAGASGGGEPQKENDRLMGASRSYPKVIAGARYARRPQGPAARLDLVGMSVRAIFWAHFRRAA